MNGLVFTSQIAVIGIQDNRYRRSCGHEGDLSQLGEGEFFTFSLEMKNTGSRPFAWKEATVRVDAGESWGWMGNSLAPGGQTTFRIYYGNMRKCMTPGVHTVVWYFDGIPVHRDRFLIARSMDWEKVFSIPSRQAIAAYRNPRNRRSPYLAGWLQIPDETRYTEYSIDFKATHLPRGTYCCLGNWAMDYSSLKRRYRRVSSEYGGVQAYGGFQRIDDGRMVSILSFWDILCTDALGKQVTIRPQRLYPPSVIGGGEFWGEGTGARSTAPYDWKAGRWYRMRLKCIPDPDSGTTLVEQWACDLEVGEYKLLSRFDTRVENAAFKGSIAVFLENYLTETAGEVRSMEVCNARYLPEGEKTWRPITEGLFNAQDEAPYYEGSYAFGVEGNRFWMITSGVGGDPANSGKGKNHVLLRVPAP